VNQVFVKRSIQAIGMPAFVLLFQWFFKFLFDEKFKGLGISFASIGIAQIFPYLFHDNLILLKVVSLAHKSMSNTSSLSTTYEFNVKKDNDKIITLKNLTMFIFIVILSLFLITLGLTYKMPDSSIHIWTGIFCAVLSLLYIIFV
jgi:hypothetical protein